MLGSFVVRIFFDFPYSVYVNSEDDDEDKVPTATEFSNPNKKKLVLDPKAVFSYQINLAAVTLILQFSAIRFESRKFFTCPSNTFTLGSRSRVYKSINLFSLSHSPVLKLSLI